MIKKYLPLFQNYVSSFVEIENDAWNDMKSLISLETIQKGTFYITPEKGNGHVAFILSGLLRTFFITAQGDEYTTDFCSANTIAANYSILKNEDGPAFYSQAQENTQVLQLELESFYQLSEKWACWKEFMSKLLIFYYSEKIHREKQLLSLSAEERYSLFLDKYASVIKSIPQYHIASYLGIKPETLSRIRKKQVFESSLI